MKKGFISMTIVYSFLLVFIFTLLAFLVLYTQKSRLVDSIVNEAKEQMYIEHNGIAGNIRVNTKLDNKRYIKDCINGSSANSGNHWVEIKAIKDGTNIAYNKPVTGTNPQANSTTYSYSNIVDNNIENVTGDSGFGYSGNSGNLECVTIDLQDKYNLDEIIVWHYYLDNRTYYSNITYVSEDDSNWIEVINEAIPETINGKKVSAYRNVANGYVQNGLLLLYDAISNTGTTRSTSTTTWKNLVSNSYNGTITSGTWGTNYLSLGVSSKVDTGINLVNTFTLSDNTTYEIVMKANSWPNTDTQYGNTGIIFGMVHYGGYGVIWTRSTTESNALIFGSKRKNTGDLMSMVYGTEKVSAPSSVLSYSLVDDNTSTNKMYWYNNGNLLSSSSSITGQSYDIFLDDKIIGINKYGVYGGSYVGTGLSMNVYSARLYNRALTEEEIYHNYLVDKERFGL